MGLVKIHFSLLQGYGVMALGICWVPGWLFCWWRLGDICALLCAGCIFRTLFKKSGNKASARRSTGVMGERSHIRVFLACACFRAYCVNEAVFSFVWLIFFFYFSQNLKGVKNLLLSHPPQIAQKEKKSGLCLINISEPFEYRHDERAILNLNF